MAELCIGCLKLLGAFFGHCDQGTTTTRLRADQAGNEMVIMHGQCADCVRCTFDCETTYYENDVEGQSGHGLIPVGFEIAVAKSLELVIGVGEQR